MKTSWIFEGNKYVVGEDITTPRPTNAILGKVPEWKMNDIVYYHTKLYYLEHISNNRVLLIDLYTGSEYWTKSKYVFWITKNE